MDRKPFNEDDVNKELNIQNAFDFGGKKNERAVEYLRYSDHNQDDGLSIEYQKEACERFINEKGLVLINSYVDAAKSGRKTANRDNFIQMIQDAKRGEFDVIVVYKFSRIFRNSYEAHLYEHELSKYNVRLISATEPIDSETIEGKLMKGIIHAFNEFTSDTIAAHVTSSMMTVAKKGLWTGGIPAFGYSVDYVNQDNHKDGKKYVINESEAAVVRKIFELWAIGYSQSQIQRELISLGYKSRRGKNIHSTTISQILRNSVYIGTYKYCAKGHDEIVIENNHDAIIDSKTWDICQSRLQISKDAFPKPKMKGKRIYPLTGKMICKNCGSHFSGQTKAERRKGLTNKDYSYYTCAGKKGKKICRCRDIRKDNLEDYVFSKIREHILNEEAICDISREIFQMTGDSVDDRKAVLDEFTSKQRELTELISNAFEQQFRTRNETAQAILDKKINDLSLELESVNEQIKKLNLVDESSLSVKKISDYLNELLEHIDSGEPALLKIVADQLVDKIIVSDEDIEVFLNVRFNNYIRDNAQLGLPMIAKSLKVSAEELRNTGRNQFSY